MNTIKLFALTVVSVFASSVYSAEPAAKALVSIDMSQEKGPVKLMNAVNNGPTVKKPFDDQKRGNFEEYKALHIPYARTHDSINCVSGGAHTCDINAIFPNFDADETDPNNYDFVFTDHYLDSIVRAGTKVFFRLGQTIEHGPKKYGALPPKDYAKWARICEHVIRHYNEGWGWGVDKAYTTRNIAFSNQFNIVYWEIWNEPDLDMVETGQPINPRCWGGTVTNFFEFYETVARHLKSKFPNLKIGGPASVGNLKFADRFLQYCKDKSVPLDFYSWHIYARTPEAIVNRSRQIRAIMDKHGFEKIESILNEWNYVKGWVDDWVYSLRVESGDLNLKGASFIAAVMNHCQQAPIDLLMFYDARVSSGMNNLFEKTTLWPLKGYYPFYAWNKLINLGTQVKSSVVQYKGALSKANSGNVEKRDALRSGQFSVVAAKSKDSSKGAALVVRYVDDDNVSDIAEVTLKVSGMKITKARCLMTDHVRSNTEMTLDVNNDGLVKFKLLPYGFALVEFE